jgi:hypothetical protein
MELCSIRRSFRFGRLDRFLDKLGLSKIQKNTLVFLNIDFFTITKLSKSIIKNSIF